MRRQILVATLGIIVLATAASAQTDVSGRTPLGLSPGAPAGSYLLSNFDSVNLYNGNLSIHLPLHEIVGRGEARYTMYLNLDRRFATEPSGSSGNQLFFTAITNGRPDTQYSVEPVAAPMYSPGFLISRTAAEATQGGPQTCPNEAQGDLRADKTLTRLTFIGADGTEMELVDKQTGGASLNPLPCDTQLTGPNRGRYFVSRDGSAASFISATDIIDDPYYPAQSANYPSGWLLFRNGLKYQVSNGVVTTIKDRNGNTITLTYTQSTFTGYELNQVTDSLGRITTIDTSNASFHTITFLGADGNNRVIKVNIGAMSQSCGGCTAQDLTVLFRADFQAGSFDPDIVQSVTIPDQRQYVFTYNTYGEVTKVALPTGGSISYAYGAGYGSSSVLGDPNLKAYIYRRVTSRTISHDGSATDEQTTYTTSPGTTNLNVTVGHSDGSKEIHYFFLNPAETATWSSGEIDYAPWPEGREYQTDLYDTNGTTVLRSTFQTWVQRTCDAGEHCNWGIVDPRVTEEDTTVKGLTTSHKTFGYDHYNNQTDICEFGYGTSAAACPADNNAGIIRRTAITYQSASDDPNKVAYDILGTEESNTSHIRNLPNQKSVMAKDGTLKAQTTYTYDASSYFADSGVACTGYTAPGTTLNRGNATATARSTISAGTITTYQTYDQVGNVTQSTDGRGYSTAYSYTDNYSSGSGTTTCAFATKITSPMTSHYEKYQYNFYLGQPTQRNVPIDAASPPTEVITTLAYGTNSDLLDRLGKVVQASGDTVNQSETVYTYDSTVNANKVTVQSDLNTAGDHTVKSVTIFDGLGRPVEHQQFEGTGSTEYISTKTDYDVMGRVLNASNPYRPNSSDTTQSPRHNTSYTYDGLGRVLTATAPGGAVTTNSYDTSAPSVTNGGASYIYVLSQSTDPASAVTKNGVDAAGRLSEVIQHPASSDESTLYLYDELDNLITVTQGNQTRSFYYDGLSRLTSATNPESGTINYRYDPNGNLLERSDARTVIWTWGTQSQSVPVKLCFGIISGLAATCDGSGYDSLNRVTTKSYTDSTHTATYTWDTVQLGRLSSVSNTSSTTSFNTYDSLGRVTQSAQDGYLFSGYQYFRDGRLKQLTYPSGRVVSYTAGQTSANPTDVSGRINQVNGNWYGAAMTYASIPYSNAGTPVYGYAAHGALQQATYGNARVEQSCYNSRMQATTIRLGSAASTACANSSDLLNLTFDYGTSANNGNLQSQTIGAMSATQHYAYDGVNRLTMAVEGANATTGSSCPAGTLYWCEAYGYDRYGNRWVSDAKTIDQNGNQQALTEPGVTPSSSTWFNSNNQVSIGAVYDGAGNQTQASGQQGSLVYDAENRLTTVNLFSGVVGQPKTYSYAYDGDGRRVSKSLDGLNLNRTYLYDAAGQLASEYQNGSWLKDNIYLNGRLLAVEDVMEGTAYVTPDHLGSTRLVTNAGGGVTSRHDYLPFGKEVPVSLGGRNSYVVTGYVEPGSACPLLAPPGTSTTDCQPADERVLQRFTGKEADPETGLDYFGARYLSSAQGRWMSPDWSATPQAVPYADLRDPQTLNLYSYSRNNPLGSADANGHCEGVLALGCLALPATTSTAVETAVPASTATESLGLVLGGTTLAGGAVVAAAGAFIISTTDAYIGNLNDQATLANIHAQNVNLLQEQGRDALGRFLPVNPGDAKPGSNAEQALLDAVGAIKNTLPTTAVDPKTGNPVTTVHDGTIPTTGQRAEAKGGSYVTATKQIRAMAEAAQAATGQRLAVVVNAAAKVAKTVSAIADVIRIVLP
jgi:RHS repeat-associated protein